jgi:hypothetical protein
LPGPLSQGDVKTLLWTKLQRQLGDDTYEQIEKGRIVPGAALLEDLMTLFRLRPAEREYLYRLAKRPVPARALTSLCREISATLRGQLDKMVPWPAYVMNPLWDVLAANDAVPAVFPALKDVSPEGSNVVWLMLTDAGRELQAQIRESREHARRIVAQFRLSYSVYRGSQAFETFIARLRHASPLFAVLWDSDSTVSYRAAVPKDVVDPREVRLLWPKSGRLLRFEQCTWLLQDASGLALVVYEPRDGATQRALEEIAGQDSSGIGSEPAPIPLRRRDTGLA